MNKKCYNQERKEMFIYETCRTKVAERDYYNLFYRCERYEEDHHKDLCDMNFDELCEAIQTLRYGQNTLSASIVSRIRTYIEWCIQHDYTETKDNHLKGSDSRAALAAKICAPEYEYVPRGEIIRSADLLRNNGRVNKDVFYKTYLLCLYEGVEDGDFSNIDNLSLNDIVGNAVRIRNGKTVPITQELKKLLYEMAHIDRMDVSCYDGKRNLIYDVSPSDGQTKDTIFKSLEHDTGSYNTRMRRFRQCFVDIKDATHGKNSWTKEQIRKSGLWERFVAACAAQGEDLFTDMTHSDTPLTATNKNKDIVYTAILNQLQSSMKWSEWFSLYSTWAILLEE